MSRPRPFRRRRRHLWLATALLTVLTIGLVSCDGHRGSGAAPAGPGATPDRPNIVFVLTDDLTWNLVRYMPHVRALQQAGITFSNFTVTDSLCCPSRASIFTGDFPHDTHVLTNEKPSGGFSTFRDQGDESRTFAISAQAAGYRTALLGKYLNGYDPATPNSNSPPRLRSAYVPPGWTTWGGVDHHGYGEYDYAIANDHAVAHYGHRPDDYLTGKLTDRGQEFIESAAKARTPFLLEVATFAPHAPVIPAPQDVGTFPGLTAPRTAAFATVPRNAPAWLAGLGPLTPAAIRLIDHRFQRRVEAVQGVDRLIGALETSLARTGQSKNTVIVFSSDNGYHMGEYNLLPGKQTAFDTDVRVPLVVTGPGIAAGTTSAAVVENIDLAPTFDELTGAPVPQQVDGRSLLPLVHGEHPRWRTVAGIEHHKPDRMSGDPDSQTRFQGVPPSYDAIRTARYTYVRYLDGESEYYNRTRDPNELDNIVAGLSKSRLTALNRIIDGLTRCHGQASCWAAGRPR